MKFIVFAAAVAASIVSAEAASTTVGIPGVFDPQTRVFVPQPAAPGAESRASTSRSGTVEVAMTITVASSIPSGTPIQCMAAVSHVGAGGSFYTETAETPATRSGTKATCTVRIPYLWSAAESTGYVQPQIMVTADRRQLMHQLPVFTLPANGTVKKITRTLRF